MKKIIFSLFFLVLTIFCVRVVNSVAEVEHVAQDTTSFRTLFNKPLVTTFVSLDAYKDGSPVTREQLKNAFVDMMVWKYKNGIGVVRYKAYSIFKEMKTAWVGDTSAAVTLVQSLYKNGKAIDELKTTYFFTFEYMHDASKSVYEVRCTVNDMAVEVREKEPKKVFNRYKNASMWPPSVNEQDEKVLSLFDKEYRSFFNNSIHYKKIENYHAEIVTSLENSYIQQMLGQHVPAKRSELRVVENGVFWGNTPLITITPENGQNKITADFDLHYTVSMNGKRLAKADVVPYKYLRETFGRSLARCDSDEVQLQTIQKYTVEEYLKKLGTFVFPE